LSQSHAGPCVAQAFMSKLKTRRLITLTLEFTNDKGSTMRSAGVKDTSVEIVDCSNNELTAIDARSLPTSLKELSAAGNYLEVLPDNIRRLTRLEFVSAGSNRLRDVTPIFQCPCLVHASFCYNMLSSLAPRPLPVRAANMALIHPAGRNRKTNVHSCLSISCHIVPS
jgi:Leucine-rich repeat (LRR) protein